MCNRTLQERKDQGHVQDPILIPVQNPIDVPDHQQFRLGDEIAHVLRVQFGLNHQMANRPAYQRPFPERIINEYPLPRNYRPLEFHAFSGEDGSSTIEHVGRFTAQLGEIGNNPFYKLQMFGLSLTRTVFSCEKDMTNLVVRNMHGHLRDALTVHDVEDLASLASKSGRLESLFRERDKNFRRNKGQHMASMETEAYNFEYDQTEEMAAEIIFGKPYVCSKLKPAPGTEAKGQPTFDNTKADEIFDILLTDGQIRIPKGQRHESYSDLKCQAQVRSEIQRQGRLIKAIE
ncbi:uncharacterized protein LOC127252821 [Andrographis paniculata]|uniref:uncharacterized protein LOC127252821 n=1 Tax=Andrographis paniculata TaxID=175694 RepID=UPI0021E84B58|nr:uncharacterized protein LOC127252821 [Andrographis paniculata]